MTELDRLVWIDLETFGLNPKTDFILEIGIKITDLELETIDDFQTTVWDTPSYDGRFNALALSGETDKNAQYVLDMHTKSGLWHEAQHEGASIEGAITDAVDFLKSHGVGNEGVDPEPMCGSSVQFDRLMLEAQMPNISEKFSYRNIDISSIKELCMRYNPRVYSLLDENTEPKKLHRVLPDLADTVAEFSFYRDNFLWSD